MVSTVSREHLRRSTYVVGKVDRLVRTGFAGNLEQHNRTAARRRPVAAEEHTGQVAGPLAGIQSVAVVDRPFGDAASCLVDRTDLEYLAAVHLGRCVLLLDVRALRLVSARFLPPSFWPSTLSLKMVSIW